MGHPPAPSHKGGTSKNPPRAHWTVPMVPGLRPKMDIYIDGKRFRCLIDTGADRTVLRKEEVPHHWKLIPGPQLLGVGGGTKSEETKDWLRWRDVDGSQGEVRPLIASGLTANLLWQDILGEAEVYITTDHKAF